MGQIRRFNVYGGDIYGEGSGSSETTKEEGNGNFVLYADHLEAIAAKDEQIRKLREALQNARDAITLLPGGRSVMRRGIAEIDALLEAL